MAAVKTNAEDFGYFNPPNVYRPAIIDIELVGEYNPNDGAFNTYRITQNDGKIFEFAVKNGSGGSTGLGIDNIVEIPSIESSGVNILRVTYTDGTQQDFTVRNGAKGDKGDQGPQGPAGIDSVTTAVEDPEYSEDGPEVEVGRVVGGVLPMIFKHIQGPQGISIESVKQTTKSLDNGGTNVITITLENGDSETVEIKNGDSITGFFDTVPELEAAHPSPQVGDYAFVSQSHDGNFPADVYVCKDAQTGWEDSGGDYEPRVDNVSVSQNTGTGHIEIEVGDETTRVASEADLQNLVGSFDFSTDSKRAYYNTSGDAQYDTYRSRTNPIAVKQGDIIKYKVSNSNTVYSVAALNNGVLDTSASILGGSAAQESSFTVPANITHLIICNWDANFPNPYARLDGSIKQSVDSLKAHDTALDAKVETVESISKSVDSELSNNLAVADFKNHIELRSNGTTAENQSFYTTDYIKVNTGDVIKITSYMYGTPLCLAAYDEDLTFLSDKCLDKDDLTEGHADYTVTGSVNYIRVSSRSSTIGAVEFSGVVLSLPAIKGITDTLKANVECVNKDVINISPLDTKSLIWSQVLELYILPDVYTTDIDYMGINAPSGVAPATGLQLAGIKIESGEPQIKFQSRWFSLPQDKTLLEIRVTSTTDGYPSVGTLLGYVYIHDIDYFKTASYSSATYYQLNQRYVTLLKNSPTISKLLGGSDSFSSNVSIVLPSKIYAVEDDTLQIFYKSIICAANPYDYEVSIQCAYGASYPRYWQYKPAGSHIGTNTNFIVSVKNNAGEVIATKTATLYVKAKMTSPSENKNILIVGDSLTAYGQMITELNRRLKLLTGDGTPLNPTGLGLSNLSFIGRKSVNDLHFEASGGYAWKTYCTDAFKSIRFYVSGVDRIDLDATYSITGVAASTTYYLTIKEVNITSGTGNILCEVNGGYIYPAGVIPSSGTLIKISGSGDSTVSYSEYLFEAGNPFWNESENKIDFEMYSDEYCSSAIIDVVAVNLGTNAMSKPEHVSENINYAKDFARALHTQYPNAKLIINTVNLGNPRGPLPVGEVSYYNYVLVRAMYYVALQQMVDDSEFSSYCSIMNLSAEFDTENSYPVSLVNANNRIATDGLKEYIGTNNSHPVDGGYYQFADSFYRAITALGLS